MIPDKETRDIQAYLRGTLPKIRRENFELRLQSELKLKARFDELKPIFETLEDIQNENRIREIVKGIKVVPTEVEGHTAPTVKIKPNYVKVFQYVAAACVLLVIGVGGYEVNHEDNIALGMANDRIKGSLQVETSSPKGGSNDCPDDKILNLFFEKKYEQFLKLIPSKTLSPCSAYYKGLSLIALDRTNEAILNFDIAKKSTNVEDAYYQNGAEWNLSLALLKINKKKKAIAQLNNILKTPDHQYGSNAKELVDSLKKEFVFYDIRF